jgi:hypothetical protein
VSGEVKIEPVVNAANLTARPSDRVRQTPGCTAGQITERRTRPLDRKTELHFEIQNHEAGDEIEEARDDQSFANTAIATRNAAFSAVILLTAAPAALADPHGYPLAANKSLIDTSRPCRGPADTPAEKAASATSATARACSGP